MTPAQILRTIAAALILGGLSLGLIPGGSCGSGWLDPAGPSLGCEAVMAPVGSWAVALILAGVVVLVGVYLSTPYVPKAKQAPAK